MSHFNLAKSSHDRTVLSECQGKDRRILESRKVVEICDHLRLLFFGKAENEILRKTPLVASHLLIESLGGHTVEFSQIRIKSEINGQ